ncbi:hypothetical protein CRM90_22485 [Mycobacterium sp. ENV421]|nr:hypothetical protein CRM90_22485 [Mycobacterium sp. ENV421]
MVGSAIQAAREGNRGRGLRVSPLAERTKELGAPVHRTALPKIESGERDITITELVGLAAALDVPPLSLLFPDVLAEIEVLPGKRMDGLSALGWFIGMGGSADIIEHGEVVHRRWFMPDGIDTDGSMIIPLQLLRIEQDLGSLYSVLAGLPRSTENDDRRNAIKGAISEQEDQRAELIAIYRKNHGG